MLYRRDARGRLVTSAVLLGCLVPTSWSAGKPISGDAAEQVPTLENLAKKPSSERRLSGEEAEKFLRFTEGGDGDLRLVSVLALAYASDAASGARLREIEAQEEKGLLSGAASYALFSRELVEKQPPEQMRLLGSALKENANPYARMFLANRIAVDFGDAAVPLIVEAMKIERDEIVKCEMLYYVVTTDVLPDSAKELLDLKWNPGVQVPEALAYIMRSLTPRKPNTPERNLTISLLSELRAKQARSQLDKREGP